ncbi:acetyl-CoA carboxylase carboxyltransferase subunit alpha [Stomatobaculum sp. F0698]|uniref:acetyl-CoA carboxylase carboxyltransferase subunit alpha n=1 Tax=Stomatobaculum sp. F0698 TaxID=3059030 RepID=UPI00272A9D90|nr:acetyl-CoA carboxylase carboxyltransferase subunit alpha [Stomatobaculum sp. F0698]WLD86036.1 acetyl-CoA carboxylase carboxyltransferase subunit alpha [Stomatobaculum sp. F0698]
MRIDFFKRNTAEAEPEVVMRKCKKCGAVHSVQDVRANDFACPSCGAYVRIHAKRRIKLLADPGSFEEWNQELPVVNPLDFPEYEQKLWEVKESTGLNEAVVTGKITIDGIPTAIGVCDARFLMSSMGHNLGEKIARMAERAAEEKLPVILYACSGGARMQEGIISLMQMVKTSEALGRLQESGQLFISVLTDPTMGGVTASFAMLGDIILAEPGALIGFTGQRVIQQTIGGKLPEGFQRAEFLLKHGFTDAIVPRRDQRAVLAHILRLHVKGAAELASETAPVFEEAERVDEFTREEVAPKKAPGILDAAANALQNLQRLAFGQKAEKEEERESRFSEGAFRSAWETVKLSRAKDRAHAKDYIDALFPDFMELHGDRCFGDDEAVIGGIASFHGIPVTVIGIQKGRDFLENKRRNFAMPNPEGYRKALRLMKQAEHFKRPVICFVDTPGAYCGVGAEERGQGQAIAENLQKMAALRTPILAIVIGEGSSGGALGVATANEVWMMENAVYSILSPEGFAAILYRDAKQAELAAENMRLTSRDLLELGVIEKIIPEPEPVTFENIQTVARELEPELLEFIGKYSAMSRDELANQRYERFRKF